MKEITMVTTCEITVVETVDDAVAAYLKTNKQDMERQIRKQFKQDLNADDVIVMKNRLFIRDVPDKTDVK